MDNFEVEEIMKPLKTAVLREELVALTKDSNQAIVLNQFLYWSERTKTSSNFIKEEMARVKKFTEGDTEVLGEVAEDLGQGWIYKAANDLIEDTMLTISKATMTRIINSLLDNGWIMKRKNPRYSGDNTPQYRVNLIKLQLDLYEIGYSLGGYRLISSFVDFAKLSNFKETYESLQNSSKEESQSEDSDDKPSDDTSTQNETGSLQNETRSFQNETGANQNETTSFQNETTLPEITSQITSESTSEREEEDNIYNARSEISEPIPLEAITEIVINDKELLEMTKYLLGQDILEGEILKILLFLKDNKRYLIPDLIMQQVNRNRGKAVTEGLFDYSQYFINGLVRFSDNYKAGNNAEGERAYSEATSEDLPHVPMFDWTKPQD